MHHLCLTVSVPGPLQQLEGGSYSLLQLLYDAQDSGESVSLLAIRTGAWCGTDCVGSQPAAGRAPTVWLGLLRAHALGLLDRLLQSLRAAPLRGVRFRLWAPGGSLHPSHSPAAVFRGAAETPRQLPGNFPWRLHSRDPRCWGKSALFVARERCDPSS